MSEASLPDEVRAACAWVMERARSVRIDEDAVAGYAAGLPQADDEGTAPFAGADPETAAAFAICMNAINFGSGWRPTIRRQPGSSGYGTMAAGVTERFAGAGPWSAEGLRAMDAGAIAAVLGQDPDHPLMAQFAGALRDVGAHVAEEHGGRFLRPAEAADSIPELAAALAGWSAFADNLVPHVLRVDGVLQLDPDLATRIEAEKLLEHGSPEEVELSAGAVHAIELLAAASHLTPVEIDSPLWNRGRDPRYKSLPQPRCRSTAY